MTIPWIAITRATIPDFNSWADWKRLHQVCTQVISLVRHFKSQDEVLTFIFWESIFLTQFGSSLNEV